MPNLDDHRKVVSEKHKIFALNQPFSIFEFIETNFGGCDSIRRVFSLARSAKAVSLILEVIPPFGIILEENEDISSKFPTYAPGALIRASFWSVPIPEADNPPLSSDNFIGYAILKEDPILHPSCVWHVFEAVFPKYNHHHNCVPRPKKYQVRVLQKILETEGVLYCQQNQLNKACAQVALRSLLSRMVDDGDISYRTINRLAEPERPGFIWGKGLSIKQMRRVVTELGFKYNDVNYDEGGAKARRNLPYQKYAYAGLESGGGALLGFTLLGRPGKHIIPIYGHTFNKDTWVPDANLAYFQLGKHLGYIPSENWTSSFLAHDDNFGPNYCVPRLYIDKKNVGYVMEIFRPGIKSSGVNAEALAVSILYSILDNHADLTNPWVARLKKWADDKSVILRSQAMKKEEYITHLRSIEDWEGNREKAEICDSLGKGLPNFIWVVEISTPQLFPANERKIGEIVLDATKEITSKKSYNSLFVLARLPETYLFGGVIKKKAPEFTPIESQIKSHSSLIRV